VVSFVGHAGSRGKPLHVRGVNPQPKAQARRRPLERGDQFDTPAGAREHHPHLLAARPGSDWPDC